MRQHHFRAGHGLRRFSRVSKRFSAAVQRALPYARALRRRCRRMRCAASWRTAPRGARDNACAARTYYQSPHGLSFILTLPPVLRSICALSALTLPALDVELLAAAPLTDTLPYTLFENFLAVPTRARITHLALPHFVCVPPAAHVVPPNAALHLTVLDSSPSLAAALGSSHLLCRLTLRIASTPYDGLRRAALLGALGSTRKKSSDSDSRPM
ncbi:hypothetical protein EDB84DRAFT_150238 [Lactarius hengduanensis]|nr:hypothetical protein EDB84DRAFT_150238 [Lactarius hengduanensis]